MLELSRGIELTVDRLGRMEVHSLFLSSLNIASLIIAIVLSVLRSEDMLGVDAIERLTFLLGLL